MLGMTSGADWLIAGLGNPEPKYDGTRHNTGFAALDALAEAWGCEINKSKWQGLYGIAQVDGRKVMLLKPLTYMNLSGQSIAPAAAFYKIPRNHIIVLCDDIAQEPGHIRIRPSGSAGGHNGLKSIIASTGGEDFYRIRIGVGAKPRPDYDLADWVLGKFPPDDAKLVTGRHTDVEAACRLLMAGKLGEALRIVRDEVLCPARAALRRLDRAAHRVGGLRARVDQRHARAHKVRDHVVQQRIVRAAEDERVHPGIPHGLQILAHDRFDHDIAPVYAPVLDQRHE